MKTEFEFHNCSECPIHFDEHGETHGSYCSLINWGKIPRVGIRTDCPLKDMKAHTIKCGYIDGKNGSIKVTQL